MDVEINIDKCCGTVWSGVTLYIERGFNLYIRGITDAPNITLSKYTMSTGVNNNIKVTPDELSDPDFLALKNMIGETTLTLNELDILYNMYLYLTDKITEQGLRELIVDLI